MKKITILFLIIQSIIAFSQKPVRLYTEINKDTVSYYADNIEIFPVTLSFTGQPQLENLRMQMKFELVKVLPSLSKKNRVATFLVIDRKKGWKIKKIPNYHTLAGNATIKAYDVHYLYDLPYNKGKSFPVYQGYNGKLSHQNENSLDFTMPEGTEVLASREGLVIDIVQNNNKSCPTRSCAPFGNYISILHSDGTIAQYYHLQQNGAQVKIGDEVTKGQFIAYSGNTGWSSGPHLHFNVYISSATADKNRITLKTLFRTGNGSRTEFLEEKKSYSRAY